MKEKIAVLYFSIGRVDVETALRFRGNDKKIANLVLLAKVFNQIPSSGLEQSLLILAKAMQVVKDGITLGGVTGDGCIVPRRQQNTIMDGFTKSAAVQSIAVDPALPVNSGGEAHKQQ